jgi:hypothetical protein
MIFPTGLSFSGPSDEQSHQVADSLLHSSELRDRITDSIYVGTNKDDLIGRMEVAFSLMILAEPIEHKMSKAQKNKQITNKGSLQARIEEALRANVIDDAEAKLLLDFEKARIDAIKVDEFRAEELS